MHIKHKLENNLLELANVLIEQLTESIKKDGINTVCTVETIKCITELSKVILRPTEK